MAESFNVFNKGELRAGDWVDITRHTVWRGIKGVFSWTVKSKDIEFGKRHEVVLNSVIPGFNEEVDKVFINGKEYVQSTN